MANTKTGRFAQVVSKGGPIEVVTREVAEPALGEVRVRVQACGVCHSDSVTKEGIFPIPYPRVPGHEVAGLVDALGEGVTEWKVGQRVGIGWYGGHCGKCEPCRRGDHVCCQNLRIPGISYDGGYADYLIAPAMALAAVPDALSGAEVGPLLCAGITTFNAIRNSGARPPDTVAILGMGGLGHLGVQYAAKMGFRTVAIARGAHNAEFAHKLGAHHYIDSTKEDVAQSLQKLGGARTILATITNADAMSAAIGGLGYKGNFVIVGVPSDPLKVSVLPLIFAKQAVSGWPSGTSMDSEDTLKFSEITGVRPLIETFPLDKAAEAYDRMISGKARFRVVLETGA
ncbi:D-arabinose 1-dehydrogenase-like Zn-dependent alcohol dehydrogenase [Silvibacterium bohemicum]|uniref:D-arabinose 1-dehydrogenase-like Zn-dependent alcohol dehydrogenase n=1 Tax=Silvibacterium bohemicum TaxID=1577686 RepID=A0A841JNL6_9BACT|nr:alcohol dehydrogenase [Silvibacterium bohemicum]MBB6142740.1 D-arabinose 1-dehydrogenase-like Zn-dependent alcohol dehydrogenase [Silvibacterium bohemicum]